MTKYEVCFVDELPPGRRKIVTIMGRSIGVFNVDNVFYAVRNTCPHKAAPLCMGMVTGLMTSPEINKFSVERRGEILKCPWHGWEFDLTTGRSIFNPNRTRVKSYQVSVEAAPAMLECDYDLLDGEEDPSVETFDTSVGDSPEPGRRAVFVHV